METFLRQYMNLLSVTPRELIEADLKISASHIRRLALGGVRAGERVRLRLEHHVDLPYAVIVEKMSHKKFGGIMYELCMQSMSDDYREAFTDCEDFMDEWEA